MSRADDFRAFDGAARELSPIMRTEVLDGKKFIAAAGHGHHAVSHRNRDCLAVP
jgi:hypothetical protein